MIVGLVDEVTPGTNALEDAVGATGRAAAGNPQRPASASS
jgi:hypothetical protein